MSRSKSTSDKAINVFIFTEPSKGRGVCYEENGIFEHEDPTNCREYYECVGNEYRLLSCHSGLHFVEATGSCEWAHASGRVGCVEKKSELNAFHHIDEYIYFNPTYKT